MSYYSSIIFIQVLAAFVMIMMIGTNPIISSKMKSGFITEFALLMLVSVTEWLTFVMNGSPEAMRPVHYAVKVIEFCAIPVMVSLGITVFDYLHKAKFLWISVGINAVIQIVGLRFGWIIWMDEHNNYMRGRFYGIFVAYYGVLIGLLVFEIIMAGRTFQNEALGTIVVGLFFCVMGVSMQLFNGGNKTAFLTAEMAFTMCYIYINNLILQTDKITGLLNRWSYEKRLENINHETCIMFFDVDSFKSINDSFGHQVGDIALKYAADALKHVFAKEGRVYRIGGDEFCVIIKKNSKYASKQNEERVKALIFRFTQEIREVKEKDPRFTGMSVGYAFTEAGYNVHWAIEQADQMMYEYKRKNKAGD